MTNTEHEEHAEPEVSGHEGHEHGDGDGVWAEYVDLLTDPGHVLVELTFLLFGEVLIALILLPLVKKYFNYRLAKAHAELDAEHGVRHDEDGNIVATEKD